MPVTTPGHVVVLNYFLLCLACGNSIKCSLVPPCAEWQSRPRT
uniref:Uncharacterized protein n=1 Tax=Anguilla anguilla TaxID=7936 RepID=A0A0E9SU50_ANGAN